MERTPETLTIEALAERAGTTVRTVRYYITQGLLTGPDARGRAAHYTVGHLDRLRLIRYLVGQHLPLREIRAFLTRLSPREQSDLLADMLDEPTAIAPLALPASMHDVPTASASRAHPLRLLDEPMASAPLEQPPSMLTRLDDLHDTGFAIETAFAKMPPVEIGESVPSQSVVERLLRRAQLHRDLMSIEDSLEDGARSSPDFATPLLELQESASLLVSPLTQEPDLPRAWRRYEIAPGLELHVRDDVAASQRALIEAILACGQTSRQENGG